MDCMDSDMVSDLKVRVETISVVYPFEPTKRRVMFLSNIDQLLAFTVETVHFFAGNPRLTWQYIVDTIRSALSKLLVPYDFMAGRLTFSIEEERLQVDCCGAGALFASASSDLAIRDLQDITLPNPAFRQLLLQEYAVEALEKLPLCFLQVTRFRCGGFAIGLGTNHTALDGLSVVSFMRNLASLAAGRGLAAAPYTDRTLLKARSPPRIEHEHPEIMKLEEIPEGSMTFTKRGSEIPQDGLSQAFGDHIFRRFRVSKAMIRGIKERAAMRCSNFEAVVAHTWRARTLALDMEAEEASAVLFAVDMRPRMNPPLPREYAGNAVFTAYASATAREMRERPLSFCVEKVQEGVRRVNDEYLRSAMDWYAVNKGIPRCTEKSILVSSWWGLGCEHIEYPWGKPIFFGPVVHSRVDIVLFSPPAPSDANNVVSVFLALQPHQMAEFQREFHFASTEQTAKL